MVEDITIDEDRKERKEMCISVSEAETMKTFGKIVSRMSLNSCQSLVYRTVSCV